MKELNKVWPKWMVEEILGQGGFGTVYKAKREEFGSVTYSAIKVVKIPNNSLEIKEMTNSGMSSDQIKDYYYKNVAALVDEIRMMETLKSATNIVTIEDFEVVENKEGVGWTIYIRMELLTNITNHFANQSCQISDVVKLGIDICSALEHCHHLNIIHRDIKPDNIFISKFGDYKLGDFGVSRQAEQSMATMSQKGTKSYMAPEMIRMEKYGKNVDLYALALTMYELLNHGRMPFLPTYPQSFYPQDREEAMVRRLSGEQFPTIEGIGTLNDIIFKACHKDPKMRFQTATEMKMALQNYLKQEQTCEEIVEIHSLDDEKTIGIFDGNLPFENNPIETKQDETIREIKQNEINVEKTIIPEPIKEKKKFNKLLLIIPVIVVALGIFLGTSLFSKIKDSPASNPYAHLMPYATDIYYETPDGIIDITVIPYEQMDEQSRPYSPYYQYGLFVLEVRSTIYGSKVPKIDQYDIINSFDNTELHSVEQLNALLYLGGKSRLYIGKYEYDYSRSYMLDIEGDLNTDYDFNVLGIEIMEVSELEEYSLYYDEVASQLSISKEALDDYIAMCKDDNITDGLLVTQVFENTLAQKYGFCVGDVLCRYNGKSVITMDDFPADAFYQHESNQYDHFDIIRQSQYVDITIERE